MIRAGQSYEVAGRRVTLRRRVFAVGLGLVACLAAAAATAWALPSAHAVFAGQPVEPAASDLRQQCINAGLQAPKVKKAYVANSGRRPYEHNSHVVGAVQTTVISLEFAAIDPPDRPNGCAEEGVVRYASARLQKTVNGHWRYLGTTWAFNKSGGGFMTGVHKDDGHGEADWEYLKPGDKERLALLLEARATNSGDTLASTRRIVPVKVIRHRRG